MGSDGYGDGSNTANQDYTNFGPGVPNQQIYSGVLNFGRTDVGTNFNSEVATSGALNSACSVAVPENKDYGDGDVIHKVLIPRSSKSLQNPSHTLAEALILSGW